jgi:hypothetical protein
MSFDLYLVPLKPTDDFEAAMATFERLESNGPNTSASSDVRTAAELLRKLDPRYTPFALDHDEIARFEGISVADAKERYNYVELNGPEDADEPLAQFTFHRDHIVVHWYSGTTEEEMFGYLKAISRQTGLSLVDPQAGKVYRLDANGEFA